MKASVRLSACTLSLILVTSAGVFAQEQTLRSSIAAIRMKNADPSRATEIALKDFLHYLNQSLGGGTMFSVPDQSLINEALGHEGLKPDGVLDLDDCYNVGTRLKVDYIVVGTVMHAGQTFSAQARVYSTARKGLVGVVNQDLGEREVNMLPGLLAERIRRVITNPISMDSTFVSFQWSQEFRFVYGPRRVDLEPPKVWYVNANPPFEVSVVAQMASLGSTYAVTNFDVFADNEIIAAIDGEIEAPKTLRKRTVVIGSHRFCFQAEVLELRASRGSPRGEYAMRGISSVFVRFTARCCD